MPGHGGFRRETRSSDGWHQDEAPRNVKKMGRDQFSCRKMGRAVSAQLPKDGTGSVQSDEKMGRDAVRQEGFPC